MVGKPVVVQDYTNTENWSNEIKQAVSEQLKEVTLHIDFEDDYTQQLQRFDRGEPDFLKPKALKRFLSGAVSDYPKAKPSSSLASGIFLLLHAIPRLLWRYFIKPKVPEPEFIATFRFGFVLLGYPFFYALFFVFVAFLSTSLIALAIIGSHILLSILCVKSGITLSDQKI